MEICALTGTLILDEDGLYDPAHFNDRLLLGLKGTMSEAELHVMQARMRGGLLSKARRGELQVPLPVGFLYDAQGQVMLDPDQQVQQSIRFLFESFRRLGSAGAVVKAFRDAKLLFPHRPRGGPQDGELIWVKLGITQTLFRVAQSSLRGSLRLRTQPHPQDAEGISPTETAAGGMAYLAEGSASWLPLLGRHTRRTNDGCRRTRTLSAPTAARAHPAKARLCCRAW